MKSLTTSNPYKLITASKNLDASWIVAHLDRFMDSGLAILAIDGPTATGKTTLTKALIYHYAQRQRPTARLCLDWFLTPRSYRHTLIDAVANGQLDPENYPDKAWDFEAFTNALAQIHQAVKNSTETILELPGIYDRETGETNNHITLIIPKNALVIVEGFGALTHQTRPYIDLALRLDVHDDAILANRLVTRQKTKSDPTKQLDPQYVKNRFWTVDQPLAEALRAKYAQHFDLLLDVTSFEDPRLHSLGRYIR